MNLTAILLQDRKLHPTGAAFSRLRLMRLSSRALSPMRARTGKTRTASPISRRSTWISSDRGVSGFWSDFQPRSAFPSRQQDNHPLLRRWRRLEAAGCFEAQLFVVKQAHGEGCAVGREG